MVKKKLINDFDKSSQLYFNEIGEFSPLSKDDETSLWERYKKYNDINARDKIIKSNLKFVASVARSFQGRGLSYSDLIAEGNLGLMKAIDKFDYTKGYKTISYSVWWIRQSILEALAERNNINGDEFPQDYEKPIDCEEEDNYLVDREEYIDNHPTFNEKVFKEMFNEISSCLSKREKNIIIDYFGLEGREALTLEEIGNNIGLTKERVRQIKEKAMKKLRSEALNNSFMSAIYE